MIRITPIIMIIMVCFISANLLCQNSNPLDDMLLSPGSKTSKIDKSAQEDSLVNDIIRINYSKKNAQLAMLMSAIVPGAGQFYVEKSNLMAYVFPVLELAVIGGILYYDHLGDKKTSEYKKYVNETVTIDINGYSYTGPRYRRAFQDTVQSILMGIHSADIYDGIYFSLDKSNTQHFYEDIGKYNKYIFGWVDWYLKYAELPPFSQPLNPHPMFVFYISDIHNPNYNSQYNKWLKNIPLADPTSQGDKPNSDLRAAYVDMRKQSEEKYRTANYLAFGIAINHIVSAIDAARTANNQNRLYLSQNKPSMRYYAALRNGRLTPMMELKVTF